MNDLKGIIFVTHTSSGGDQLVFRYPPIPKGTPSSAELGAASAGGSPASAGSGPASAGAVGGGGAVRAGSQPYHLPADLMAALLIPKRPLCDADFELRIDSTLFLGRPTSLVRPVQGAPAADEPTLFNLVLVLGLEAASPAASARRRALLAVLRQLSAALRHEHARCGYLTAQVADILHVRESSPASRALDYEQLCRHILSVSSFAQLLRDAFHALRTHGHAQLLLNHWLSLALSLKDAAAHPRVPLRPYQTLLLLTRPAGAAPMAADASPQLRRFLTAVQPTKTFQDVQLEAGLPLASVFRMAAHLIHWDMARVIHTLAWANVYVTSPQLPPLDDFHKDYALSFPRWKLADTLALFSQPQTLGDHANAISTPLRRDLVNVVVWLLKHQLLVQLHKYVYLVIPRTAAAATSAASSGAGAIPHVGSFGAPMTPRAGSISASSSGHVAPDGMRSFESLSGSSVNLSSSLSRHGSSAVLAGIPAAASGAVGAPLAPSWLEPHEIAYVEKLNDQSPTYELFRRLCPYFRGRHHLLEICWRENITRDELNAVLERYAELLAVCLHTAPE